LGKTSSNITSKEYSIVPMKAFSIYSLNYNRNTKKYILSLDRHNYYMMNIVDYIVGNTDRHLGNWGVLVNNSNNKPVRLYDLMNFKQAFNSYNDVDGSNCQTMFWECINQKEATVKSVKRIGLNQTKEVDKGIF
jgi:Phosphatidylinositol 3- and 4-kinase.